MSTSPGSTGPTVVVFEVGSLGDSVMTVPAMRALRLGLPDARIVRVHDHRLAGFFRGCPWVDELLGYDKQASKLVAAGELLRALRRVRPDVVVNLHTPDFDRPFGLYLRDGLFFGLTGARERVAFGHSLEGWLYTRSIPRERFTGMTMDEANLALVGLVGAKPGVGPLRYWLDPRERVEARSLLARTAASAGVDTGPGYFCVSPFARAPAREWSMARMGRAAAEIAAATGLAPVLLGGRDERARLEAVTRELGPHVDLVGTSSLRDAAALLEGARLLVAVDSGLMHLGALCGTRVVGVFGPGNPVRWRPLPQAPAQTVHANPPCGPCFRTTCDDLRCQRDISVDAVVGAALRLVA